MDGDHLKCNRLTCRRLLSDKAVVAPTYSAVRSQNCYDPLQAHNFSVDCANELFNASRLCPACETALTEPDDVVVCSLHPSNDYKTSVLSGLSPSIILEICNRAISFWQYQSHQENSFQQAVVRNVNDKNAQLTKQLENVVREANGEINLLNNKNAELMRDLELERRKVQEMQEAARERDKEYQKLKGQLDKIKRKALLAPQNTNISPREEPHPGQNKLKVFSSNSFDSGAGMETASNRQTPLANRAAWQPHPQQQQPPVRRTQPHRQPFAAPTAFGDPGAGRSFHSRNDSTSSNEVENMLVTGQNSRPMANNGWTTAPTPRRNVSQVFAPRPHRRVTSTEVRARCHLPPLDVGANGSSRRWNTHTLVFVVVDPHCIVPKGDCRRRRTRLTGVVGRTECFSSPFSLPRLPAAFLVVDAPPITTSTIPGEDYYQVKSTTTASDGIPFVVLLLR
uniref:E3 ubiquitin-protein ligase CCNB1IP1 n=1 Tax=Mycena chlorophos TaxID=658473 RepID=A0ABQ0KYN4_MYCCL|nr:predicted protein [Mycena chlorophos]